MFIQLVQTVCQSITIFSLKDNFFYDLFPEMRTIFGDCNRHFGLFFVENKNHQINDKTERSSTF